MSLHVASHQMERSSQRTLIRIGARNSVRNKNFSPTNESWRRDLQL